MNASENLKIFICLSDRLLVKNMYKFVVKYTSTLEGYDNVFSHNVAFEAENVTQAADFVDRLDIPITMNQLYYCYHGRLIDVSILEFIVDSYMAIKRITNDVIIATSHLYDTVYSIALRDKEYQDDLIKSVEELYSYCFK